MRWINAVSLVLCSLKQKQKPTGRTIWSWQPSRLNTFNCFCDLGGLVCHGFQGFGRTDLYEIITVRCTKELWVTKASSRSCCGSMVRRMDQMCDDVLFGYILHIGAFQQPRTFHLECSLNSGSDRKSSRFCKWGVFIFSPSCDTKPLCYTIILKFLLKYIFKKILPNFLLMYNIMLGSGIFHSDLTFTHIMKWSCGNSSSHLPSYKFIKILSIILLMVYITFLWLVYFITGKLYL